MTGALAGITLALLLSLSSLAVVLLRVSPLTAAGFALPFLFLSLFIAIASASTLLFSVIKGLLMHKAMRSRSIISSSMRQGIFVAIGTCFLVFLHLLRVLNWWIAVLVYAIFVLIELALNR